MTRGRILRGALGAGVWVASVSIAIVARADAPPNAWDEAKDSQVRTRWELHKSIARSTQFEHEVGGLQRAAALEEARAELEDVDAAHSPDPLLRFDLGEIYERLEMHGRAIDVLAPALEAAPRHPSAAEAWGSLAYAYAHLDKTEQELDAYQHYLEVQWDGAYRVTALLNVAEGQMRLGHLPEAIEGYRETIALASSLPMRVGRRDEVLGMWGLAVALDRSGDPTGASAAALQATQIDMRVRLLPRPGGPAHGWELINNTEFVFFVPEYERCWYLALGYTEDAKHAPSARLAAREWATVEAMWGQYVSQAEPHDRWVQQARGHLERAHRERAAADKRARAEPAPKPERDALEVLIR